MIVGERVCSVFFNLVWIDLGLPFTASAPTSPVKGKSSVLKSVTSAQFSVSPEVASRSFDDTSR